MKRVAKKRRSRATNEEKRNDRERKKNNAKTNGTNRVWLKKMFGRCWSSSSRATCYFQHPLHPLCLCPFHPAATEPSHHLQFQISAQGIGGGRSSIGKQLSMKWIGSSGLWLAETFWAIRCLFQQQQQQKNENLEKETKKKQNFGMNEQLEGLKVSWRRV